MIHVVLGMHKSGTTLVSRMLHESGVDMVDSVDVGAGYDEGNTWERESTKRVNHAILGSFGAYSLKASSGRRIEAGRQERDRMREIVRRLDSRHGDWGFKDPRTCLTYDLWAEELPEHRIVVIYRTADEVWAHYWRTARGARRWTVLQECLPRWCEYNEAILAAIARTAAPAIVMHYTRLMQDDGEMRRLEQFLGRPLVDLREPRMSRSRPARFDAYRTALALHRLRGGRDPAAIAADLDCHARGLAVGLNGGRTKPMRWHESFRRHFGRAVARSRDRRASFRHELAVGAIFKDEARYLDEWLTFHHGVGVEHFYLYDDNSTDDSRDVLAPWVRRGLVTVRPWSARLGQVPAYNDCIRRFRSKARWLALIDIDEFLFAPGRLDLREVLRGYADLPAIFVYWVLFGSNGHVTRPSGPVVESYTRCLDRESALRDGFDHRNEPGKAEYVTGWAKDGKSIVNPRMVRKYVVHRPRELWEGEVLDENRLPPVQRSEGETLSYEILRINHYWSKSLEDLAGKVERGSICDRGRPKRKLEAWLARERMLNVSEDTTILPIWRAIQRQAEGSRRVA